MNEIAGKRPRGRPSRNLAGVQMSYAPTREALEKMDRVARTLGIPRTHAIDLLIRTAKLADLEEMVRQDLKALRG